MAEQDFDPTETKTPAAIGEIVVNLHDPDGTNPNRQADGAAEVLNGNGKVIGHIKVDDLRPILSATQRQQLATILDDLRTRAESKLP